MVTLEIIPDVIDGGLRNELESALITSSQNQSMQHQKEEPTFEIPAKLLLGMYVDGYRHVITIPLNLYLSAYQALDSKLGVFGDINGQISFFINREVLLAEAKSLCSTGTKHPTCCFKDVNVRILKTDDGEPLRLVGTIVELEYYEIFSLDETPVVVFAAKDDGYETVDDAFGLGFLASDDQTPTFRLEAKAEDYVQEPFIHQIRINPYGRNNIPDLPARDNAKEE